MLKLHKYIHFKQIIFTLSLFSLHKHFSTDLGIQLFFCMWSTDAQVHFYGR